MASIISMKALLESGVHFGHRTNKWNPSMRQYIFTERNGIHIIDLQQTVKCLTQAYQLVSKTVANGGTVLFVGTKRQAQETIQEEATRCGMPYVTERWLPGTLTNWVTILERIHELERLEQLRDSGEIHRLTKKESLMIEREIARLHLRLSGLRNMRILPELVFIIDVSREDTAVHEANLKNIPIIAMVDTNCDPSGVDYVIPSNDDAIRAIKLLVGKMADAVLEGKAMRKDEDLESVVEQTAAPTTVGKPYRRPMITEEELDESDLLGESTLAKIGQPHDTAEEVTEEKVEAKVEEVIEDKVEAKVEKVTEEKVKAKVKAVTEEKVKAKVKEVIEEKIDAGEVDETVESVSDETTLPEEQSLENDKE